MEGVDARKGRSWLGILITNSNSEGFKSKKASFKGFFRENKWKDLYAQKADLIVSGTSICVQLTRSTLRGHNTEATMVASCATITGSINASPWY